MNTVNHSYLSRTFSALLMSALFSMGFSGSSYADIVPTADLYYEYKSDSGKAELKQLLNRQELRNKMLGMGVDISTVDERINSMTDQEAFELQKQIESLPAGEGFLGLVIGLLVIFILTDVAGATDIFPGV